MKHSFLYLILLLLLPISLQAKSDEKCYTEIVAENDGKIYPDDSIIVSIRLYATHPICDVHINDSKLKINGCHVRRLYTGNENQQVIIQKDDQNLYTVVCAQYSVASNKKGVYYFPQLFLTANLYIQQQNKQQDSDPFNGFFDDFFNTPAYKKEKKELRTSTYKMQVVNKPQKTMEELRKSGKIVI